MFWKVGPSCCKANKAGPASLQVLHEGCTALTEAPSQPPITPSLLKLILQEWGATEQVGAGQGGGRTLTPKAASAPLSALPCQDLNEKGNERPVHQFTAATALRLHFLWHPWCWAGSPQQTISRTQSLTRPGTAYGRQMGTQLLGKEKHGTS